MERTLRPLQRAAASYPLVGLAIGAATVAGAAATAFLVAGGMWYAAAGLMLAVPIVLLLHRYPLAGVMIWLLAMPFLVDDRSQTTFPPTGQHRLSLLFGIRGFCT